MNDKYEVYQDDISMEAYIAHVSDETRKNGVAVFEGSRKECEDYLKEYHEGWELTPTRKQLS